MLKAAGLAERIVGGRQPPLPAIRNFVLLQHPTALGTAIHATPLVAALRACVPGARVAAVASGFALEVLRDHPGLERLVESPSPLSEFRGAVAAMRSAALFDGQPYAALQTQGNERSRLVLASLLAGAGTRAGFTVMPELSRAPLVMDPAISMIRNNLRIVEALGHGRALAEYVADVEGACEPVIYPDEADREAAEALLRAAGVAAGQRFAVLVTQTSPTQQKGWRAERFAAVAQHLESAHGLRSVLVGTAAEAQRIDQLRQELGIPSGSVAGQTSLRQLAAVMGRASVAVCLDTGPMHIARAMQLPMVIIAPAWSPVVEWLPVGNPRARILKNADMAVAPPGYIIDEVSAEEVVRSVDELLLAYPA